jgi:hypothetical protein
MRQSLLASFDVDPYLFRWESVDICRHYIHSRRFEPAAVMASPGDSPEEMITSLIGKRSKTCGGGLPGNPLSGRCWLKAPG